jgi:hypothetical protein
LSMVCNTKLSSFLSRGYIFRCLQNAPLAVSLCDTLSEKAKVEKRVAELVSMEPLRSNSC